MEVFIFQKIDYDVILVSPYEFIKSFVYDFSHNLENDIRRLNLTHHIANLESVSVYMAKMMLHDEIFTQYK